MTTTRMGELADRDRAVAGLPIMISAAQMARWLSELAIDDHDRQLALQPDYLRYKPGTSLLVGYRTEDGPLFGYAVSPEAEPKLDKLVRDAPPGSIVGFERSRRLVLARPAADRDLPGLRTRLGAGATALAYKPQRRFVGAVDDRILRCYRRSDLADLLPRWPAGQQISGVRTPVLLETHRRTGSVSVERLPGQRLDQLSGDRWLAGLEAAGSALARWHRQAPTPRRVSDLPSVETVADQLLQLLPDERARIESLAGRLTELRADLLQTATVDVGWCHGDFSVDQVLVTDTDEISLLDWDRSGSGPVAVDLAAADAAGSHGTGGLTGAEWQALTAGYQRVRPLPAGLQQFRAIAHFTRVIDPFRSADPDWSRLVRRGLDRVEAML